MPQDFPAHDGVQLVTQMPAVLHVSPLGHVPHVLPHPSGPHDFPAHEGVHPHVGGDAASYAAQLVSPMPSEPVVGYVIVAPVESLNAKL